MMKQLTKTEIIDLLKKEIVESVDSAHNNESHNFKGAQITLEKVKKHLKELIKMTDKQLLNERYEKFRKIGN